MKITEEKNVYKEFKVFKNLFTAINKAISIRMTGLSENTIYLNFSKDSEFFELTGLLTIDCEFTKWLNGKTIETTLTTLKEIKSCLKKDVISIEYDDKKFIFTYNSEDGKINKSFEAETKDEINMVDYSIFKEISPIDISEDILVCSDNSEKILEIASAKLLVTQSDKETEYTVWYRTLPEDIREIVIKSNSLKNGLILEQKLYTI